MKARKRQQMERALLCVAMAAVLTSCGSQEFVTISTCRWTPDDHLLVVRAERMGPNPEYIPFPPSLSLSTVAKGGPFWLAISCSDGGIVVRALGSRTAPGSADNICRLLGDVAVAPSLEVEPEAARIKADALELMKRQRPKAHYFDVWVSPTRAHAACAYRAPSGSRALYLYDNALKNLTFLRDITLQDLVDAPTVSNPNASF